MVRDPLHFCKPYTLCLLVFSESLYIFLSFAIHLIQNILHFIQMLVLEEDTMLCFV